MPFPALPKEMYLGGFFVSSCIIVCFGGGEGEGEGDGEGKRLLFPSRLPMSGGQLILLFVVMEMMCVKNEK